MFTATLLFIVVLIAIWFLRSGYPPAPPGLSVLHRGEAAFVRSAAEVLFPDGSEMPVSGVDAQLPHYIDRHLAALPASKRWQIRALFFLMEHLTLVWPSEEEGRKRFSTLTAASRVAKLDRLAEHPRGLFRLVFIALRGVLVLGYLGHPANLRELGLAPFEIERAVSDAELLFPRVGGLVSSIPHSIEDRTTDDRLPPLHPESPRERAYLRARGEAR